MADEALEAPDTPKTATKVRLHTATILVSVDLVDDTGAFVRTAETEVRLDDPTLPQPRRDQMEALVRGILKCRRILA